MGLLKILRKVREQEKELRLLVLGLDNAGKTTIVRRFGGEEIHEIAPTLGFDIKTLQYQGFSLNLWDVGGQQTIRSYWRNYFEATDGIIWVVDAADRVRLQDCKRELWALLGEEKLAGATLLVFANKQDIPGALTPEEIADRLELSDEVFGRRHWQVCSCSAVTADGLAGGVDWLLEDIASRVFLMN